MLFDTCFFIDLAAEVRSGAPGPIYAFLVAQRSQPRAVSVVTIGEFAIGARPPELRATFRGFRPLSLGLEGAVFAGRLQAALSFEMGENDLWIAATA